MPVLKCPTCRRNTTEETTGICPRCTTQYRTNLDTIADTWHKAHNELMPNGTWSGDSSSHTFGSKPPCNINALSWEEGRDITNVLSEWEKLIREERHLMPVGHLKPLKPSDEITRLITFHRNHATWSCRQPWADDLYMEIATLARHGKTAAKIADTRVRIMCPGETHDGDLCGRRLVIPEDHREYVTCNRCNTAWTVPWLMRVALENVEWLDAAHLQQWFAIAEASLRRWVKQGKVRAVRVEGQVVYSKTDALERMSA